RPAQRRRAARREDGGVRAERRRLRAPRRAHRLVGRRPRRDPQGAGPRRGGRRRGGLPAQERAFAMSLRGIVAVSVRRRGVVLALWAAILGAALLALPRLSIDAVPDVTNTQVSILTSAPGLSPLEVEQYLTFPVEMAMNGVPGLD